MSTTVDEQVAEILVTQLKQFVAQVHALRDELEAFAATDAVSHLDEVQKWVLYAGREVGGAGPMLELAAADILDGRVSDTARAAIMGRVADRLAAMKLPPKP